MVIKCHCEAAAGQRGNLTFLELEDCHGALRLRIFPTRLAAPGRAVRRTNTAYSTLRSGAPRNDMGGLWASLVD